MKKLITNPLFLTGIAIRLAFVLTIVPKAETNWYLPFIDITFSQFTLNPWQTFLDHGGVPAAFPYGYVMWLIYLPLTLLIKLIGGEVHYAYAFTLLSADIALLFLLRKMLEIRDQLLLSTYWLSPIVLLATYWLGLNDLIPVLLLCIALYFTKEMKPFISGAFCGAAISAKLSMILAIPFFLIYFFRNKALRIFFIKYLKGISTTLLLFCTPFIFSSAGLQMLLNNPEMGKIYEFNLRIGKETLLYILPMTYLLMLYGTWRVRRLNFELLNALLGIAFLLVVLLTPASPGWFIWIMPLLVFYQAMSGRIAIVLVSSFSILYVLASVIAMPLPEFRLGSAVIDNLMHMITSLLGNRGGSLLHTIMVALGIVLVLRIWRQTISFNDYFRLSRKPFVVGIAGDSGAGKDTLVDSLEGLFGAHSVARLSGDDYHLWDRQKPMWQVITHLNPVANDLERYANDLLALIDGKPILSKHYNHNTGKMSHPHYVRSNDFIIASGLHTLYLPILRKCYNLSIYLDISEDLRRYFKLKRDVILRGHTTEKVLSSLEKREPDSVRFIRPQASHADLVMALQPVHPRLVECIDSKHPVRLKLFVRSRNGLNELSLTRVLIGVCGLNVDMDLSQDGSEISLTIEGETVAEDIAMAAKLLFPRLLEFLDITPRWQDGVLGLMQLITLSHINQALNKSLL